MPSKSRRAILASLGASLTALAGCSSAESPANTTTRRSTVRPTTAETTDAAARTTTAAIPMTGPPPEGAAPFDDAVPDLMDQWDLSGGAVAVMHEGRLVFTRGYGYADREARTPVQPTSLFRIGSISKPLTAVGTLSLVEDDALSLDDRAFDILSELVPEDGPADARMSDITVRQLLRHTAGFDTRQWGFDPMFAPARVAAEQGVDSPASVEATIRFVLDRDLGFDPGSAFAYSNVGYCILGRVLKAVTEQSYERAIRETVFSPLGIDRMQIGGTRQSGLLPEEVRYYGHQTVDSPFPDQGEVPRPYGSAHLRTNAADGGWVGSTADILRFVRGVDRRSGTPDILQPDTLDRMTERPDLSQWADAPQFYGMGWYVVPNDGTTPPSLWHNGSLPGSYSFLLHRADADLTLAALFNSRPPDQQFAQFNAAAQQSLIQTLGAVENWPDGDRFGKL